MIKKLLFFIACASLAGSVLANQPTAYKVIVTNNTAPGFDLYLTQVSASDEISGCNVYWPDSNLSLNNGTVAFTLYCNGHLSPALHLTFITNITTQNPGQTCWGTYYTSQFVDPITNISIHPDFTSYGTCGSNITPPTILLSHPDPGK